MSSQSFDEGNFVRTDLILTDDYPADQRVLQDHLRKMVYAIGDREIGAYPLTEVVNGQKWFANQTKPADNQATNTRFDFRTVVNFGVLPNAGPKSVAHGITTNPLTTFTRIYATATDLTGGVFVSAVPIPFADPTALANAIMISVDNTNVTITTGSNRTNFTVCYVVLEYLQT